MYFAVSTGYGNSIHVFKKFYRNLDDVFNKVVELRKTCYEAHEEAGWKRFFYLYKLERRYKRELRRNRQKKCYRIKWLYIMSAKAKTYMHYLKWHLGLLYRDYIELRSKKERLHYILTYSRKHFPSAIGKAWENYKAIRDYKKLHHDW